MKNKKVTTLKPKGIF